MIPRETIDDILRRLDIVDVIQRYVPLTRKGKNFVGLCPFHEDGNPSLSVSREKQIFKCFSCGTAGNSISFLQKYKNISYMEAVQEAVHDVLLRRKPYTAACLEVYLYRKEREVHKVITALECVRYGLPSEKIRAYLG